MKNNEEYNFDLAAIEAQKLISGLLPEFNLEEAQKLGKKLSNDSPPAESSLKYDEKTAQEAYDFLSQVTKKGK